MITKQMIISILEGYTQDMDGYSEFGPNFGISNNDYEKIANEILAKIEEE